jgi:dextranase
MRTGQNYLAGRNNDVYQVLDFDGFHIDQLGNRNHNLYNYNGQVVDLPSAFNSFVHAMKNAAPSKYHVMNAVNQYAQQQIAASPVDFLYSEVWNPNNSYQQLAQIITDNDAFSDHTKNSVLAAYMNYDLASGQGFFNTPGVLLTNAVILSFGGSHLELGEHMLGKEYFPNNNLQMRGDLRDAMVAYYDFQTAYQNLLRGWWRNE